MKYYFGIIVILFALVQCTQDFDGLETNNSTSQQTDNCDSLLIAINEIAPGGSGEQSADWVELYNPRKENLVLEADQWYITDDLSSPDKFELPSLELKAQNFLIVLCDDLDKVDPDGTIHTNFKLSKSGEAVGIFRKTASGFEKIDAYEYAAQDQNTISRIPDGCGRWKPNTTATYNKSNN